MTATSLDASLSSNAAYRIERRLVMPRIDTVERLASVLGVSPGWLAYGIGTQTAHPEVQTSSSIGKRLAEIRFQRGLSRGALGSAAQTTGQTIANIETGGMVPKVDTVELLAKALGVSPSWLAFGVGTALAATVRNEIVPSP